MREYTREDMRLCATLEGDNQPVTSNSTWEKTSDAIRYRVRKDSRFDETTLKTIVIDAKKGISAEAGMLKKKYGTGQRVKIYIFSLDKKWTLKKAKAWLEKRGIKNDVDGDPFTLDAGKHPDLDRCDELGIPTVTERRVRDLMDRSPHMTHVQALDQALREKGQ